MVGSVLIIDPVDITTRLFHAPKVKMVVGHEPLGAFLAPDENWVLRGINPRSKKEVTSQIEEAVFSVGVCYEESLVFR
jgi:hypothetical protein